MTERHRIGEAVFDITFGAHASFGEAELATFVQERLLPVMEDVFDQVAADGTRCRIEQLVVDLGEIPVGLFEEELPIRFREELRRRLREKMRAISSQPHTREYVMTRSESHRTRLQQFLETGRLLHDGPAKGQGEIDGLLLKTVRADPVAFAVYVRHSVRNEVIIRRLARQFSADTLAELLRLLDAEHSDSALYDDAGASPALLERRLRKLLINDPAAGEPDGASPVNNGDASLPAVAEEAERYAVSRLRGHIEHAFVFGDPRNIYHNWTNICIAHPALVRAIFMRRMGAEASRRRLAEGFPQPMLLDLTSLLAPGHDRLLAALLEQPEMREPGAVQRPEDIRNAFWFYTLTYLHNAGPDRFRPEEYLRGLIPHLEQSSMERARVNAMLRRVIPAVPRFQEKSPQHHAHPDLVLRRLLRRLAGERSEPPMAREIAWLARAHPGHLRQLYHQLRSGDTPLDTAALETAEAEALVAFFVNPAHPRETSSFLAEIEKHAGQARDRRLYYLHVLENIAHSRIVDLEQAMALSAGAGEGPSGATEVKARFESLLSRAEPDHLQALLDNREPGHNELACAAFLRATADAEARRRMVLTTPEPLLLRLVTLLLPQEGRFFHSIATSPHLESTELRHRLWEEIVAGVHAEGACRFDHDAFSRRLHQAAAASPALRALAHVASGHLVDDDVDTAETRVEFLYRVLSERLAGRHTRELTSEMTELATAHPEVFRHLIDQLHGGEITIDAPSLTAAELGHISVLASRHCDSHRPPPPPHAPVDTSGRLPTQDPSKEPKTPNDAAIGERRHRPRQELRTRLAEAMVIGQATPIGDRWSECMRHPVMVRSAFMRQMGTETSRRRLAEGFPTPMLLDLAALLAPHHHQLIATLLDRPELHSASNGAPPDRELLAAVWSYTLAFLHDTGSGEFRPHEYLRGLAPHLAHSGMEAGRLHTLLGQLTGDTEPSPGLPPPCPDALYRRLNHRLGGASDEPAMGDEIRWLARHRPDLLQQLFRQLQPRDVAFDLHRIDGDEASALVAFLAEHEAKAPGFLTEIEKHAARARNRRSYFLHILQRLLSHRTVDLEHAMGLQDTEVHGAAESAALDASPAHKHTPPSDGAHIHIIDAVEQRLRSPERCAPLTPLLEELAHRETSFLASLYKRWRSGEFAAALPHLAPGEVRFFVLSFAEVTTGGVMPGFRRQVEAYAELAVDQEAYYRFLLGCFISDETIDLERAAAQPRNTTAPESMQFSPRRLPPSVDAAPRPEGECRDETFIKSASEKTIHLEQADAQARNTVAQAPVRFSPNRPPSDVDAATLPDEEWRQETYVANAGMVITAPFLPRLFSLLELTTEQGFRSETAAARAVHLLQHMVNESSDSPEFLLPLNKLLCGVPPSLPIVRAIEVTGEESEAITGMLQALIAHWKIIGNTSVPGLRESFLQREGRLRFGGDRWLLEVEKRGMDVLLEQIPWSFSMVKYSWMPWPLHVEWL